MPDVCAFCGPSPRWNADCPTHGRVATTARVELTRDTGPCEQHPTAPVIGGLCGGCTRYPIDLAGVAFPVTADFEATVDALCQPLTFEPIPPMTMEITADPTLMANLIEAMENLPPAPEVRQYRDEKRREEYGNAIREYLKSRTVPGPFPGSAPVFGATEYEIADFFLTRAGAECEQLQAALDHAHAERNAALALAEVWADAPDPLVRASAADLKSAIRGAKAARRLDCGWCYEEDGEEVHPHPECPIGAQPHLTTEGTATASAWGDPTKLNALNRSVALALHKYDYEHGLTVNDTPGKHHHGEASEALAAITSYLTIADADAWCKACRRIWEGPRHRCESDAEQRYAALQQEHAQLDARLTRTRRALAAVQRFNKLTADSCRVQAAEHARDNLDLLDSVLDVPLATNTSSAREDLLNLLAQWGLTTGRGSREHADRILDRHTRELAD
ncbi:hypothetical protein ACIA7S_28650 [Streptomyces sp. NPDC051643]|uniref:hypothetical protein n=1 Tax=Streptomyces sp. NPDC051643 TaxID=3365665 RepID=UPI0037A7AA44